MRREDFIRRLILMGGANALNSAKGILLLPVLTRLLGVRQYGIFSQFIIALQILLPLATLNLEAALLRFLAGQKTKEDLKEGLFSSLMIAGVFSIIIASLCFWQKSFLQNVIFGNASHSTTTPLFIWFFPLLFLHAISLLIVAYFRATEKFPWFAGLWLFDSFFYLLFAILLVYFKFAILGIIYALFLSKFIIVISGGILVLFTIGGKIPRFSMAPSYLNYCLPLLPSAFFYFIIQFSDRYVIIQYRGIEDVAQYNTAYIFSGIITLVFSPFFQLIIPRITALWNEGKKGEAGQYLERALKYTTTIYVPILFLISIFGVRILEKLATKAFVVNNEIILLIMGSYVLLMLGAFCSSILALEKKTRLILTTESCMAILNLVLNYSLIPFWGILGAALATFLTFFIKFSFFSFYSRRFLRYSYNIGFSLKIVISSLLMTLFILTLSPIAYIPLPILITGGIVVYAFAIIILKGFTKGEISTFRSAILLK